jgi:hypothetical protein
MVERMLSMDEVQGSKPRVAIFRLQLCQNDDVASDDESSSSSSSTSTQHWNTANQQISSFIAQSGKRET